jgi:hypothetical protein
MEYAYSAQWIAIAVVIVALVGIVVLTLALRARHDRHERALRLRRELGPEYDRAVAELGGRRRAERELLARKRRVAQFAIRPLSVTEHERFATGWNEIQTAFVDSPTLAVERAHVLVKQLMAARGYPVADFDQRVKDLSVTHPIVAQHYRAARALHQDNRTGEWDTEELRQAMVHYRALFAELLERPEPAPFGRGAPAHSV